MTPVDWLPVKVFVLAGQSNMVGIAQPVALGTAAVPNLLVWRAGHWEPAADPLQGRGVGPGMTFGKEVLGALPEDTTVGLVMCGASSSSIGDWQPEGILYARCVRAALA